MNFRHWFAIGGAVVLILLGLFVSNDILAMFSLPSSLAVIAGGLALVVIAALEFYGFRLVFRILRKKGN